MENIDVSVIIVNYNTRELLFNCLQSIYNNTKDVSFEIIVSDNGSTDKSIEMVKENYPKVILIENNANLGFGAANNRGLNFAKGKYVFYLNSDTLLHNNAIKLFFDFYERCNIKNDIGAIGCNLLDENFKCTHSYGYFPNFKSCLKNLFLTQVKNIVKTIYYVFKKSYIPRENVETEFYGDVDYITGADLFLLNNEFAMFDEHFFLYFEETFLELKLRNKGLRRILIDGPKIQHLTRGGVRKDFKQLFLSRSFIESYYSMIMFFRLQGMNFVSIILAIMITILYINPIFLPHGFSVIKNLWRKVNGSI